MKLSEKSKVKLEFDKVLLMLADCALTAGAKQMALQLMPEEHADRVLRRQRRTSDARKLMDAKGMPTFGMVTDIGDACERACKGATLTTRELLDVANVWRTARLLLDYIHTNHNEDTSLDEIFMRLIANKPFEQRISKTILSEDMIADEASPALQDIRRRMRHENVRIKNALQQYISGGGSKYLQDNIVTMRGGRYVIPVKIEHKSEIKGLLHDTSSSGATVFIEPMEVVDANNELRHLEAREEREIERILLELSSEVGAASATLNLNYRNINELAFCFACGELSRRMRGVQPILSSDRSLNLIRFRHPLIDKKKVVPVDVHIGKGFDTMVITGPNTGGKTVTLKTLGLSALMAQAGLHIPADEGSSICLFDRVLADIGDEQSIEQSLSTFSSHMVHIVDILSDVTGRSLVLFDELGVGTDPVEGAALAIAIIESVRERGAMCAATTHYAELKAYALETEGVTNAACEFDVETLRPTYRLVIGSPGKSNAFAISQRLGLPEAILARAESYVSADNKRFETVIEELERERVIMEKNRREAERLRAEYSEKAEKAEKEAARREREAETALEKARAEARALLESARASSDYILSEMDKVRKAKESDRLSEELEEARRQIRNTLRTADNKLNPVVVKKRKEGYVLPRPLKSGDEVTVVSLGVNGFLLSDPDKSGNVTVKAGIIKTKVNIKDLMLCENTPTVTDKQGKKQPASKYSAYASVSRSASSEIDLRGMTGDEGWMCVDKYLDEAMVSGLHTVHLIHGKGTGALRNEIWYRLADDDRVASYRLGAHGEGDSGVTVVELW